MENTIKETKRKEKETTTMEKETEKTLIKSIIDINSKDYAEFAKNMAKAQLRVQRRENRFGVGKVFEVCCTLSDSVEVVSNKVRFDYFLNGLYKRYKNNIPYVKAMVERIDDKDGLTLEPLNALYITGTSLSKGKEFHAVDVRISKDCYLRFFLNDNKVELLKYDGVNADYLQVGLVDDKTDDIVSEE